MTNEYNNYEVKGGIALKKFFISIGMIVLIVALVLINLKNKETTLTKVKVADATFTSCRLLI